MCKREIIWVVATLVVAACAWVIYDLFIAEEYVEPGVAPEMALVEDADTLINEADEPSMDLSGLSAVGDDNSIQVEEEVEEI